MPFSPPVPARSKGDIVAAPTKGEDDDSAASGSVQTFAMEKPVAARTNRVMRTLADGVTARNQREEVHSYLDEYNCWPPPIFVIFISIIQISTFLAFYFTAQTHRHGITRECAGCFIDGEPGPFTFVPTARAQAWRFFTYQFTHAGLTHLLGNVFMQLLIGVPLEIVHKIHRIAPLYCLAVICGAMLHYTMDPTASLVGASGGVYALIAAHLANVVMNWAEMPFRLVRLALLGLYVVVDVGAALYRRYYAEECDRVSHMAHVAGAFTGFCLGVFTLYNLVELKWERIVRYTCLVIFYVFFIVILGFTIFQPPTAAGIWAKKDCAA